MKLKTAPAISSAMLLLAVMLTGCGNNSSNNASSILDDAASSFLGDSTNVRTVKDSSLSSCPSATLGEMADAFMSNPSWSDFPSTSGGTVVELKGEISYGGSPSTALIQFNLTGSSFEAVYLGINDVDQNKIMLSSLLTKMCDAV